MPYNPTPYRLEASGFHHRPSTGRVRLNAMAVHIQLDKPHAYFTNLDFITGRVLLTTFTAETISAINVKLECESRTRLAVPPRDRNRNQTEIEVHKVCK